MQSFLVEVQLLAMCTEVRVCVLYSREKEARRLDGAYLKDMQLHEPEHQIQIASLEQ